MPWVFSCSVGSCRACLHDISWKHCDSDSGEPSYHQVDLQVPLALPSSKLATRTRLPKRVLRGTASTSMNTEICSRHMSMHGDPWRSHNDREWVRPVTAQCMLRKRAMRNFAFDEGFETAKKPIFFCFAETVMLPIECHLQ